MHPGPAPLRRLTHEEYDATIRDLLGSPSHPARQFPPQARALGFHGIAEAQNVTSLLAENYQTAAKSLAQEALQDVDGLLGCDPMSDGCVEDFIERFGALAYRRPLETGEIERLSAVYEWGRDNMTFAEGVAMVLEVLLQSPHFLYRPEFGGEEVEAGVVELTSFEMATRLSYLLSGSMPDAELRRAAAADELRSAERVKEQAERLLETASARETFRRFHTEWLHLDAVTEIDRDPAEYPGYSEEIPELFRQETEQFIEHVLFEDDARLQTLFTAPYTMANGTLAKFYGLPEPAGEAFELVPTDPNRRAGLLTQGSVLAHHSQPLSTSPVQRGKFIRESILCQLLTPPPADLVIQPPDLDPDLTTRERFAQHSADPSCAGCHRLMDPVGLGFEHFDSVGRWRDRENGRAIDASGELVSTDVSGDFYGAVELADRLAASDEVAQCMIRNWIRFSHGRSETPEDACTLASLQERFVAHDYDIRKLVLELTQTDAFLYRKAVRP